MKEEHTQSFLFKEFIKNLKHNRLAVFLIFLFINTPIYYYLSSFYSPAIDSFTELRMNINEREDSISVVKKINNNLNNMLSNEYFYNEFRKNFTNRKNIEKFIRNSNLNTSDKEIFEFINSFDIYPKGSFYEIFTRFPDHLFTKSTLKVFLDKYVNHVDKITRKDIISNLNSLPSKLVINEIPNEIKEIKEIKENKAALDKLHSEIKIARALDIQFNNSYLGPTNDFRLGYKPLEMKAEFFESKIDTLEKQLEKQRDTLEKQRDNLEKNQLGKLDDVIKAYTGNVFTLAFVEATVFKIKNYSLILIALGFILSTLFSSFFVILKSN